nr:zinc-ribbon domain-containing protein [bacterium]
MTTCPECGKELKPGAKFCNGCGAKMPGEAREAAPLKSPPSPQTARTTPPDSSSEPAQRVNRSEEARRKVALRDKSGDTTPVLADTFRAVVTEGGTVEEVAAADLPRVEPAEPPRANFAAEVKSKYWNLFIAAVAVATAGLVFLAVSAIRRPRLERPVQYTITRDSFYFSTTRKLCRFDTSGRSSWVKKESGSWMLRGMIFFDIAPNGNIWIANPFRGTVDLLEQSGKWLDQFGLGKLGSDYRFASLGDGNVAISIRDDNRVDVIDMSRKLVASAGGYGSGFADLRSPGGVAELPDGYLIVADTLNLRIQVLDREYKFVETWNFPYNAVIPGDKRTEKVAVNHPGHEISLGAKYFPDSLAVDAKRGLVYVSMLSAFGKRPGIITTMDFNGNTISSSEITTRSGQRVNPRSITATPDGLLTIVDPDAYIAGEWDPESGFFVDVHYQEISDLVAGMKRSSAINTVLRYCGSAFTMLGIAGLAGLMSLVGSKQRAAWLGQDAEHRYTRRRAQSFSTEIIFHIPGPENVSPSRQWRGTLSDAITAAVVPVAIIISFIIRLILIRTSTPQLALYIPAAV